MIAYCATRKPDEAAVTLGDIVEYLALGVGVVGVAVAGLRVFLKFRSSSVELQWKVTERVPGRIQITKKGINPDSVRSAARDNRRGERRSAS
jgi:hypothetical protein